jgi:hypothetical protein
MGLIIMVTSVGPLAIAVGALIAALLINLQDDE